MRVDFNMDFLFSQLFTENKPVLTPKVDPSPSVPPAPWKVEESKHSDNAEKCRIAGNKMFKKKKLDLAIEYYNRSLCYAPPGSVVLALAYGNRSEVYSEMGKYGLAFKNINLARKNGFPIEHMSRLDDREKECRKLIQKFGLDKDSVAKSFFKLSHPT